MSKLKFDCALATEFSAWKWMSVCLKQWIYICFVPFHFQGEECEGFVCCSFGWDFEDIFLGFFLFGGVVYYLLNNNLFR